VTTKPIRAVRLDPLTEDEYPAWLAEVVSGYADSQALAGIWTRETAEELAAEEIRRLLPEGRQSPGHHLWIARDAETAAKVGALWLMVHARGGRTNAFIYDVHVDADRQGGGYGRAIMEAGSATAKQLGADVMVLNVHGYNDRAYNLYKSLGYRVASRHMRLEL
jgi:ribosomal protein S18 acetylase RimI-like enzyme